MEYEKLFRNTLIDKHVEEHIFFERQQKGERDEKKDTI